MNNTLNKNETVKLEAELNVISDIRIKLSKLLFTKISKPSKAYSEIEILVEDISKSEKEKKEELLAAKKIIILGFSEIKIDSSLHENLISLRERLKLEAINSTIEFLLSYYENDLYNSKHTSIEDAIISRADAECFVYSKFKLISLKDEPDKIVYSTDDLILKDGTSYLDLRSFKSYSNDDTSYFSFSSKFTLSDVDDFFSILKR